MSEQGDRDLPAAGIDIVESRQPPDDAATPGAADPETAAVMRILESLLSHPPSDDPDKSLIEIVAKGLEFPGGVLWEPLDGILTPVSIWAGDTQLLVDTEMPPSAIAEEAWRTRRPAWSLVTPPDSDLTVDDSPAPASPRLGFPVFQNGEPTAVVELYDTTAREPNATQTSIATALGIVLGAWRDRQVIEGEQAAVFERLGKSEARLRLLAEISRTLSASVDEDTAIDEMLGQLVPQICDACSVYLLVDDGSLVRVAANATPALADRAARFPINSYSPDFTDEYGVGSVVRTGLPLLYREISDALLASMAHDERHLELLRALGLTSAIVVPLIGQARVIGALTLVTADSGRTFTADDLSLLEDLGRRAGLALSAARLLERERSIAVKLQSGLLPPRLPSPAWSEIAARYEPGQAGTLVGGDFYDSFWAAGDKLVIVVGDVCGHGPEAAAMTSRIRYATRALAKHRASPADVLHGLNEVMNEDQGATSFFTAICAMAEPKGDGVNVVLACGGHPPPVVLRRSGKVEEVDCAGMILGFYPEVEIHDHIVELDPGDLMLMYTDGVTELRDGDSLFGRERLYRALRRSAGSSADDILDVIMSQLADHNPDPRDDMVMVAVKAKAI